MLCLSHFSVVPSFLPSAFLPFPLACLPEPAFLSCLPSLLLSSIHQFVHACILFELGNYFIYVFLIDCTSS